jgi:hypothetical protein
MNNKRKMKKKKQIAIKPPNVEMNLKFIWLREIIQFE